MCGCYSQYLYKHTLFALNFNIPRRFEVVFNIYVATGATGTLDPLLLVLVYSFIHFSFVNLPNMPPKGTSDTASYKIQTCCRMCGSHTILITIKSTKKQFPNILG